MNYLKMYFQLVDKALERPQDRKTLKAIHGKVERHHIVPQCVGGPNEKWNLVFFTIKEHRLAHLLLAKADPHNVKFAKGAFFMSFYKDGRKMNAKMYEKLRSEYVDSITGVTKTPEHCKKIGLSNTGKKLSDQHKANISVGRTGCKVSEVANKARSEKMKLEHANGLRKPPMLGRRHSEITKEILRNALDEGYENGSRISPFADPLIWQKAQETIKRNAANGKIRKKKASPTEEQKEVWRQSKLERDKIDRLTCPKCGKDGPKANMLQYHFDKCGVQKYCVTNGEIEKHVTLEETEMLFQNGFRFGAKPTVRPAMWMTDGNKDVRILPEEQEAYLANGFIKGRRKGRKRRKK